MAVSVATASEAPELVLAVLVKAEAAGMVEVLAEAEAAEVIPSISSRKCSRPPGTSRWKTKRRKLLLEAVVIRAAQVKSPLLITSSTAIAVVIHRDPEEGQRAAHGGVGQAVVAARKIFPRPPVPLEILDRRVPVLVEMCPRPAVVPLPRAVVVNTGVVVDREIVGPRAPVLAEVDPRVHVLAETDQ